MLNFGCPRALVLSPYDDDVRLAIEQMLTKVLQDEALQGDILHVSLIKGSGAWCCRDGGVLSLKRFAWTLFVRCVCLEGGHFQSCLCSVDCAG